MNIWPWIKRQGTQIVHILTVNCTFSLHDQNCWKYYKDFYARIINFFVPFLYFCYLDLRHMVYPGNSYREDTKSGTCSGSKGYTHWLSGFDSKYYKFRNVILSLFLGLHFSFNQIPDNQNSCPVIWSQRTFFILKFLLVEYYIFFELF